MVDLSALQVYFDAKKQCQRRSYVVMLAVRPIMMLFDGDAGHDLYVGGDL